jgi:hypothetical protein
MNLKKAVLLVLLIAVFLTCGFFRDYVFLNVNEEMRVTYYHSTDSTLAPGMKFLESYSYSQMYYIKWALTFLFSFLFMLLTMAFVRLFFPERKYLVWTLFTYLALVAFAALFWFGGFLANDSEKGYIFSRFLMGMAQSPVVLMVLIPSFRLLKAYSKPETR